MTKELLVAAILGLPVIAEDTVGKKFANADEVEICLWPRTCGYASMEPVSFEPCRWPYCIANQN